MWPSGIDENGGGRASGCRGLTIPWAKRSKIKKDLKLAQEVLDNDHYGLDKVKERIVEYLAVQQRANKLTGPKTTKRRRGSP